MQTLLSDAYLQRFAGIGRLYGQQALRLFAGLISVLSASVVSARGLRKHWRVPESVPLH